VKLFAVNDTVYLWAEQKGDTVVVEKEVVVERVVLPKTNSIFFELMKLQWFKEISYFIIVLVAIYLIKRLLKNYRKD